MGTNYMTWYTIQLKEQLKAKDCFNWFYGNNRLYALVYDPNTKSCRYGIDKDTVNQNQGAENTISYCL